MDTSTSILISHILDSFSFSTQRATALQTIAAVSAMKGLVDSTNTLRMSRHQEDSSLYSAHITFTSETYKPYVSRTA